jgi:patatin-like phospholipase/acyl hydrolase
VVGGTSIGGILALGCAGTIDGKTPVCKSSELVSLFDDCGTSIFNSSKIVALWNNLRDKSKYCP